MSYEEEDTCINGGCLSLASLCQELVSYEEEDTCMSYEEEDTCINRGCLSLASLCQKRPSECKMGPN